MSMKSRLRELSLRGYSLGSRAQVHTSAHFEVLLPTSLARAGDVNRRAVAVLIPPSKAIDGSTRRFGQRPSSPKAKEGLIVAVTRITLEPSKTKAVSARRRAALIRARSTVSRAFVRTSRQEEMKKGVASWKSLPSRKTRRAPHHRRWS